MVYICLSSLMLFHRTYIFWFFFGFSFVSLWGPCVCIEPLRAFRQAKNVDYLSEQYFSKIVILAVPGALAVSPVLQGTPRTRLWGSRGKSGADFFRVVFGSSLTLWKF